ncbi:MAG: transaldolase [Acidobacteriota bacterium]
MSRNPLLQLKDCGQAVWLDNLSRPLIQDGSLQRLISRDGVSGVTSNPAIFHKAMTSGDSYQDQLPPLAKAGSPVAEIYEELAIRDIQEAADLLRPIYQESRGTDGFVSLEVSPHLARETQATVDEASRLWKKVDRPNIFIKIPGTEEGLPAIQSCLAQGININITLLFSLKAYRKVMEAYIRAMESRQQRGEPFTNVASVASFFLSRIDVKVDRMLENMISEGSHLDEARALKGKAAIASAKLAYQLWKGIHQDEPWQQLAEAGAQVQKPLWASTSTKNPDYSDVMYVEPLIGPRTVNTMPEVTLDAFRDHGKARRPLPPAWRNRAK